ncbi:MAG: discoidin domain-containing protein [Candidatus Latescibacterota bacterium]|nr:discoidin domain-containing protein [Candidatus Latescibacterota bacterium]
MVGISRILVIWLWVLCCGDAQAQGYRLLSDRVEVSRAAHWQDWTAPEGTRIIHADGTVEPRFIRRDINAVLNAGEFRYVSEGDTLAGGIGGAGSNIERAPLVIDGDDETSWEPELDRPVDDWWVDVDLGRAVVAQRIAVRFAQSGDPFLKFRVMVSDGRTTFTTVRRREFFRVGLVNIDNKTQREFVFEVEPRQRVAEGLTGAVTQVVRIEALASDGVRGAEIERATHEALPEADRGVIDYFRRTRADRQIRVEQEIYDFLPAAEQAPPRYYRRERPRLAEVEVIALGDNAARLTRPSLEEWAKHEQRHTRTYTDGLLATFFFLREYNPLRDENQIQIDLGAKYWLDRIRLLSPGEPPPAYQLRVADGALNPDGELIWRLFDEKLNREGFLQVEESFPSQEIRYIDLRRLAFAPGDQEKGQISEIQAYGEGYVSEVVMVSPIVKLRRSMLFSVLTWAGETPRNTQIEVRTRAGNELLRVAHYFTPRGSEISQVTWERRSEDRRGPVVIEELPGDDWSNWSEVYHRSGAAFKSPSPRRYALFEVRLKTTDPLRTARIWALNLHFEPPLVDQAFAELWPVRGIEPGREEEFTLYVRPEFAANNPGFDRLRLQSSSAVPLELLSVRAWRENLLRLGRGLTLWPGVLQVERSEEGALDLVFPEAVDRPTLYAIRFRTQVFLGHTQFSADLRHADFPARVQQISAGPATELVASQSLVAVVDLEAGRLLEDVTVNPPVLTPNGDGINDESAIEAKIFAVEGTKRLQVGIFDLAGRRVRDLSLVQSRPSGTHRVLWDGRDGAGRLVPPGVYAVRLALATDARRQGTQALRLIHVVY